MKGLASAFSFLTVIGRGTPPTASAGRWFPVVGLLVGSGLGVVWWMAERIWAAPLAATLVVGFDLAVTGMLHLDGLVDSADGLLPHLERSRRLALMSAPDVGAFGLGVGFAVLAVRWAALANLSPNPLLLAALWGASRSVMTATMTTVPYARGAGLASGFGSTHELPFATAGLLAAAALAFIGSAGPGLAAVLVGVGAGAALVGLARRRLGGFTGDVLGAAGVLVETTGLLVAAARW